MSSIADHVVRGASNPPLQSRQTATMASDGTSRHAAVVTRAYEPHPAMINPLTFVHQHPQHPPYSPQPSPNSQSGGLSPESNNRGHNSQSQCMFGKPQDRPRWVPRIPAHCGAVAPVWHGLWLTSPPALGLFPSPMQHNPCSLVRVLPRPLRFRLVSLIGMSYTRPSSQPPFHHEVEGFSSLAGHRRIIVLGF